MFLKSNAPKGVLGHILQRDKIPLAQDLMNSPSLRNFKDERAHIFSLPLIGQKFIQSHISLDEKIFYGRSGTPISSREEEILHVHPLQTSITIFSSTFSCGKKSSPSPNVSLEKFLWHISNFIMKRMLLDVALFFQRR